MAGCLFGVLLVCSACDQKEPETFGQPGEQEESSTIEDMQELFEQLAPHKRRLEESASREMEKLFVFEYHVEDIARDNSAKEMEARLARLGRDRWECYHVEPIDKSLRFFCKRRPKTYLKYIPKMF